MKYEELVEFNPIETVIILKDADEVSKAKKLVESYVLSDEMAEKLTALVFLHLQFRRPYDSKGLFVVGNYGTGKSHLMALISAIAEHKELTEYVSNQKVSESAEGISGKFKVIRMEIGATRMPLRDIVLSKLEEGLAELGVSYRFPGMEEVSESKSLFLEMMTRFSAKYPDTGLLFVLDELFDYLRSRRSHELVLDLNFLRELGESCKASRFKFMAGIQETLFENPRLPFVAESVRRVKARFQEIYISRTDIEYVIAERLLKKDSRQKRLIRSHLEQFTPLYNDLNERMDRYIELFPVHPAYIDIFEQISFVEKREILKTLSTSISAILEHELPKETPGVLTYDSYWDNILRDPSFKAIPEVTEVIKKSSALMRKIAALSPENYKRIASRIICGLSVHRLTTGTIKAPIGATIEQLRDQLCLPFPTKVPAAQRNEAFLKTNVEMILRKVMRLASGQYISYTEETGQYYLDVEKDIDYEERIEQKAESLSDTQLDRYYFSALARLMECTESTYVPGFRIWEHELLWVDHGSARRGYLFFGAPNQRPTTQSLRNFYLYFLPIFEKIPFHDETKSDEVFYRLKEQPEEFRQNIRLYGGASELAAGATIVHKSKYLDKAETYRKNATEWLYKHVHSAFEVTYQGTTNPLQNYRSFHSLQPTFRERVNFVASTCLSSYFLRQNPEYPMFSVNLTSENRGEATRDVLRYLGGGVKTKLGAAVLEGLELLEGENIRPEKSKYAKHILSVLREKKKDHVVNRGELVDNIYGIEFDAKFRLEPELLVIVLAALVRDGQILLSIVSKKFDASNLSELVKTPLEDLIAFNYIEKPKEVPIGTLRVLFEVLDLSPGLVQNVDIVDEAIITFQKRVGVLVNRLVETQEKIKDGLMLWNTPIFSEAELITTKKELDALKEFLESLQVYNSPGKLRNFRYSLEEVEFERARFEYLDKAMHLVSLVEEVSPLVSYLSTSEALLEANHPWIGELKTARQALVAQLSDPEAKSMEGFKEKLLDTMEKLKTAYIDEYMKLHRRCRLNANYDNVKARLVKDERFKKLKQLAQIDLLPRSRLSTLQNRLASLHTCFNLVKQELESSPVCPHCNYRPVEEPMKGPASAVLEEMDKQLDTITREWEQMILANLGEQMVLDTISLLKADERALIEDIIEQGALPVMVSDYLVSGLEQVFSGLVKIVVPKTKLLEALTIGGMPCTAAEYKNRFEEHLKSLVREKDQSKIRILIEDKDS